MKKCLKPRRGGDFGFTLSEVLIALVIIGVIAAITLPVLWSNYQEHAIRSALKKNYSVLKQALDRYQADNSERLIPSLFYEDTDNGYHLIKPTLMKYLNVMYDCGYGNIDVNASCIPNQDNTSYSGENTNSYKNYTGTANITFNYFDDGQFVLNDGTLILLEDTTGITNYYISADVNGFAKKPNRLGKDLFMFQLTDDGELLPMGAKGTTYYTSADTYCSKTSQDSMNGAACTAKVLKK